MSSGFNCEDEADERSSNVQNSPLCWSSDDDNDRAISVQQLTDTEKEGAKQIAPQPKSPDAPRMTLSKNQLKDKLQKLREEKKVLKVKLVKRQEVNFNTAKQDNF